MLLTQQPQTAQLTTQMLCRRRAQNSDRCSRSSPSSGAQIRPSPGAHNEDNSLPSDISETPDSALGGVRSDEHDINPVLPQSVTQDVKSCRESATGLGD
jgi:hypothetical protein